MEMIWYHGTPDSSVKEYLLLDYKVSMPFNLKPDIFCSVLWDLHFINENLKKLINVSGKRLKKLFEKLYDHTKFVEDCNIEVDNSSTSFELINISQFIDVIPSRLQFLSKEIERITSEEEHVDFKNCTIIQSQIGQSLSVLQNLLLPINTSDWKLEKKQSFQPISHKSTYWWLLFPAILVCLLISLWKKCQWSSSRAI
ncbi:fms-related tyrosine kinase 3 ligand isoform X2 [Ahaetulla prasina]|uniref:fms-related tyrosine kinase 3 ligand isoform X2 n=1 Tax=Ahaetulla prasina TaxID=499056 RepID=UPI0026499917|nr:fms-related tyrosine kinase 3 ligand isoform X2 [Ahaetulla prasina]XP_058036124.1 fms-related tyrosine kinase 3 ligand isoform X2 [Ahaetulla prasina]